MSLAFAGDAKSWVHKARMEWLALQPEEPGYEIMKRFEPTLEYVDRIRPTLLQQFAHIFAYCKADSADMPPSWILGGARPRADRNCGDYKAPMDWIVIMLWGLEDAGITCAPQTVIAKVWAEVCCHQHQIVNNVGNKYAMLANGFKAACVRVWLALQSGEHNTSG